MSVNCPTCGRLVETIFEHVDVACENWPDRSEDAKTEIKYRGYHITRPPIPGYSYCHEDYDDGDTRHGYEKSLDLVYRAIDEREDDDG